MSFGVGSRATDAADACASNGTRHSSFRACGMAGPSGLPFRYGWKTKTGRTGKRLCPWERAIRPNTRGWRRHVPDTPTSAARVAVGAIAKQLLKSIDAEVLSHVIAVGKAHSDATPDWPQMQALKSRQEVLLNCADSEAEQRMKAEVDQALRTGDSVGGVFEVIGRHVPPGLGTYANW